jgi:uncharacterized protein YqcC (DUF446 family)
MATLSHAVVEAKINQIETEMKNVGMWQDEPLPPDKLAVKAAFGQDKLSFEQWLQFIFIPRVKEIIATKGNWPPESQVSLQAWREWKQYGSEDKCDHLLGLLKEFDALFTKVLPTGMPRQKGSGCTTVIVLVMFAVALVATSLRALAKAVG